MGGRTAASASAAGLPAAAVLLAQATMQVMTSQEHVRSQALHCVDAILFSVPFRQHGRKKPP